jgi:hypothetical protein
MGSDVVGAGKGSPNLMLNRLDLLAPDSAHNRASPGPDEKH